MLRTLTDEQKADWKSYVPSLVHAYHATLHSTTGYEPFYLMFGRKPRLPIDLLFKLDTKSEGVDYPTYIAQLKNRLQCAYELTSRRQKKSAHANKKLYDAKCRGAIPQIGDRVLVRNTGLKGKHKIANKWQKEVFLVVDQIDPSIPVYQIQPETGKGRLRTVHRNLIFP